MSIVSFDLASSATQAAAPFSLGQPFKQGDVPAGSLLVGDISDLQVTPKNVWPDGSLKFAVIGGLASLVANTPLAVILSIGTPVAGTDITTAKLVDLGITAGVTTDAFGDATWAGTDWNSPHETWVSGPKMSWFRYRKQIGTDAHLVAWLDVRVWANDRVAVKAWVENGYLMVTGPSAKSATYTFTLNGTQRYTGLLNIRHHTRIVLLEGAGLEHWIGVDPDVTPDHDIPYLVSTELVAKYEAAALSTDLASVIETYAPHMIGGYIYSSDIMEGGGYKRPIGLFPEHEVAYLICNDNRTNVYRSVLRNGYCVGRYPIHYRDETTAEKRIPLFTAYPALAVYDDDSINKSGNANQKTPINSGGTNSRWDVAHSPSVGFMAHLISGDKYHLETALFAAFAAYFSITPPLPTAGEPIRLYPVPGAIQTRQVAWGFRAVIQALSIIPASETALQSEFAGLVERVTERFHRIYLEQPNNQYGWIKPGEYYPAISGGETHSPWQQGFVTGVFGYAVSLNLPISQAYRTKLSNFFQWKAKSIVTLLGPQSGFWYVNGAAYRVATSTVQYADYEGGTGPWLTPAESYARTYSVSQGFTPSATEGVLAAEFTSDTWGENTWGMLHFPLAYAVRHGVEGAAESYTRLTTATNYSAIQGTFDSGSPVWSIKPASIPAPTEGAPMGESLNIDSSSLIVGALVIGNTGGGVLGANLAGPVNGKAGYLYDDIDPVADADKEICGRISTWPTAGNLKTYEGGGYSFTDAPDGIYSFEYQLTVDYQTVGPLTTEELVVGGTQATAAWTEGADVVSASAVTSIGVAVALGWTEGADAITATATASVGVAAVASWTEGTDSIVVAVTITTDPEDIFHVSPSCTVNFDGGTNRVDF